MIHISLRDIKLGGQGVGVMVPVRSVVRLLTVIELRE